MAVEVWTIQMGQWRKAKALGIELVDITVKSGLKAFAPTWEMVESVKTCTPENKASVESEYVVNYRLAMQHSWLENREEWVALLGKPKIALACYCKAGDFCHRTLLVGYLKAVAEALGVEFNYMGEL